MIHQKRAGIHFPLQWLIIIQIPMKKLRRSRVRERGISGSEIGGGSRDSESTIEEKRMWMRMGDKS